MNYGGPEHLFGNLNASYSPTAVDLEDQARRLALVQSGRKGNFDSLKALARIYNVKRWEWRGKVLIEAGKPVGAVR